MATRSNIAYKTAEGKIRSVYCHWDGYPEHNGEMLNRYYTDFDKVKALVDLGSLSCLRPKVNAQEGKHNFESPQEDVTIAYHRDRGESLHISEYDNVADYVADGEEYMYLYSNGEWLVNDHQQKDSNGFPVFDFVSVKIRPDVMKNMGWDEA